jgi:hypothetical protein
MSITANWYPSAPRYMYEGNLVTTGTFKIALLGTGGTYNASHTLFNDVNPANANELSGAGYTAGGASVTVTSSNTPTASTFTLASAASWTGITLNADVANAVLYESGSGRLMMHLAFSPTVALAGQDFFINPPSPAASITLPA